MTTQRGIAFRLTLVFVLFAGAIVAGGGLLAYASGRQQTVVNVDSELAIASTEKHSALEDWVDHLSKDVTAMSRSPALVSTVEDLLATDPGSLQAGAAQERVAGELRARVGDGQPYLRWLVLDPQDGKVIVDTDGQEEGKYREDQPYFVNGKGGPFVQGMYYSAALRAPAMTVSAPVTAASGRLVAVLAARIDLTELNAIILRRTGNRQTDDAFLVNTSSLFVTQPRLENDPAVLTLGVHSEAAQRCLARTSGVVVTDDYRGIPAIINYAWLPTRNMCLIVKVDKAEAFAPIEALRRSVVLAGGIALLVAATIAAVLARSITRPVIALRDGAARFGRGELDTRLQETGGDELGGLAREFNIMATSLSRERTMLRHQLERMYGLSSDLICALGFDGYFKEVNPSFEHVLGYQQDEMLTTPFIEFVHPDDRVATQAVAATLAEGQPLAGFENRYRCKDGSWKWLLWNASSDPREQLIYGMAHDVTERKQAEAALVRANRIYALISQVNQMIVRTTDVDGLLRDVCRIAVEFGGFRMAWIGMVDDGGQRIRPAAQAGFDDGYLSAITQSSILNVSTGRGQTSAAVREGKTTHIQDIASDPRVAPWREEALRRGYRSSIALPIRVRGEVVGAFSLYASEAFFFNEDESRLLEEVVADIAFALEAIDEARQRAEAESALVAAHARLRGFVDANIIGVAISRPSGEVVETNDYYLRTIGYTREEFEQGLVDWRAITPAEWLPADEHAIEELRQRGVSTPYEKEYLRRDGSRVSVFLSNAMLPGADDAIAGYALDITERKRAEAELRHHVMYLRALQETMLELLSVRSLDALFVNIVRRAGDLVGTAAGFLDLVDPGSDRMRPHVAIGALANSLNHPATPGVGVAGVVWQTGAPLIVEDYNSWPDRLPGMSLGSVSSVVGVPLLRGNDVLGAIGLGYEWGSRKVFTPADVDLLTQFARLASLAIERAELLAAVQAERDSLAVRVGERTAELEQANRELEAFAYSVSHDLRAPLRAMHGFSAALLSESRDQLDEQGRHYLDRIGAAAKRMGELIDALLDLSRISRREMGHQPVDLSALAREVAAELQTQDPQRPVEWVIADELIAQGDANLLSVALQNLLGNAWKFTGPRLQPRIEVGLLPRTSPASAPASGGDEGGIIYFVRDNGMGFDMAYADKLFAPFQRLHGMREFPGTGIGLATVQRVIARHGGRVWAEAQVDQGATFYFTLESA